MQTHLLLQCQQGVYVAGLGIDNKSGCRWYSCGAVMLSEDAASINVGWFVGLGRAPIIAHLAIDHCMEHTHMCVCCV
jgi:hypothetical protein